MKPSTSCYFAPPAMDAINCFAFSTGYKLLELTVDKKLSLNKDQYLIIPSNSENWQFDSCTASVIGGEWGVRD